LAERRVPIHAFTLHDAKVSPSGPVTPFGRVGVGRFAAGVRASNKSVGFAENRLDGERRLRGDGKLVCPLPILGRG
jgi:hypothetical protein